MGFEHGPVRPRLGGVVLRRLQHHCHVRWRLSLRKPLWPSLTPCCLQCIEPWRSLLGWHHPCLHRQHRHIAVLTHVCPPRWAAPPEYHPSLLLRYLSLTSNKLRGTIPDSIGNFAGLTCAPRCPSPALPCTVATDVPACPVTAQDAVLALQLTDGPHPQHHRQAVKPAVSVPWQCHVLTHPTHTALPLRTTDNWSHMQTSCLEPSQRPSATSRACSARCLTPCALSAVLSLRLCRVCRNLELYANQLTGTIPPELAKAAVMEYAGQPCAGVLSALTGPLLLLSLLLLSGPSIWRIIC